MKTFYISTDPIMKRTAVVIVEDGITFWTTEQHPDYIAWIEEGNTPEEWSPE